MAHSTFRNQLIALANENVDNPSGFLEGLSDIHLDWHMETPPTYGFLLFHHQVVRYFTAIVNSQLQPTPRRTRQTICKGWACSRSRPTSRTSIR